MKKKIKFLILSLVVMVITSYWLTPASTAKVFPVAISPNPEQEVTTHDFPNRKPRRKDTEASNCSPAYPNVCIPPAPPDLDCSDITERNFEVLADDPHRFDGDKDGIGCESA